MLFNTPTQFTVLALLVIIGWLFGFASHSGGKRWRAAYDEEALGRAQDRDELDAQLRHVDGRIAELEQENAALAAKNAELTTELDKAKAARGSIVAPALAGAAVGAVAASAARPTHAAPEPEVADHPAAPAPTAAPAPITAEEPEAEPQPEPAKRSWFDWGKSDDLTNLRGVDADLAGKLKDEGVGSFKELASLSDQDEIALERRLDLPAGFIQREEWRQQASLLADGDAAGHTARFGDRGEPVRPLPLS